MQPPADSPIPPPQLQQTGPPTPQQLQLQIQQRQQQQASQQQDSQQSNQSTNIGPAHNPQQVVSQPPQSSVPQQPSLQSHQPVKFVNYEKLFTNFSFQIVYNLFVGIGNTWKSERKCSTSFCFAISSFFYRNNI